MTDRSESLGSHAVAIIGMAGRFPKANSIAEFWRLLRDGREGIHFLPRKNSSTMGSLQVFLNTPNTFLPKASWRMPSRSNQNCSAIIRAMHK